MAHGRISSAAAQETIVDRVEKTLEVRNLIATLPPAVTDRLSRDRLIGTALTSVKVFVDDPFSAASPSYKTLEMVRSRLQLAADSVEAATARPDTVSVRSQRYESAPLNAQMYSPSVPQMPALSLLTGETQTKIIAGAADFFVERAKDELVLAYLGDLKASLDSTPLITALMPATARTLQTLDLIPPRGLVPQLRTAAQRDFVGLPDRATNIKTYQNSSIVLPDRLQTIVQASHLALHSAVDLRRGMSLEKSAAAFMTLTPDDMKSPDTRAALILVGVAATEYVSSGSSFATTMSGRLAGPYAVAFLFGDAAALPGFSPTWNSGAGATAAAVAAAKVKTLLTFAKAHQADIVSLVAHVQDGHDALVKMRADLSAAQPKKLDVDSAVFDAVTELLQATSHLLPSDAVTGNAVPMLSEAADLATELMRALHAKDYAAILNSITPYLLADATPRNRSVLRVMSLASTLATASDAQGVTNALNAAAEPVGSYRAKRVGDAGTHPYSITLNGYVGLGGGAEWSTKKKEVGEAAGQFGLSIPVGLEMTVGGTHPNFPWYLLPLSLTNGFRSWGLFVPLVDLGNVANFRLKTDSLSDMPTVGFSQVFAPGLFVMAGIGDRHPFSVGLGGQYAPGLRKTLGTTDLASVIRLSVIFGVDVPVIRF